ncbi:MAG: hypothetical protein LBK99_08335 [Opitutaceae bacterium]|nr:hypothetical protein [Opitutaceae bacterium]
MIGEKGGADAVNDATLWNSVRRLEKRIAGIDVEMPGATDARKKSLADMRAVYSRTLTEKRGLMDELAGRGEGFWGTLARTGADALKSYFAGSNALLKMVGDIYGLATGDFDNAASRTGKEGMEFWQGQKSERARMLEDARSRKVGAEEGWHRQAWAYIRETASNPAMLANVLAEQAPNFVGTGGVGAAARAGTERLLLRAAVKDAAKVAAAKAAARVGMAAAVGTEVAMQGADVAGDFYADFMQRLDAMPEGQAKQIPEIAELMGEGAPLDEAKLAYGLSMARKVDVLAMGASALTKFLPGAQTIEKTLVGGAAKKGAKEVAKKTLGKRVAGAVGGAIGEAGSEAIEEGSGQFGSNLMAQPVDPGRPLMKDVGEAVGQAVVTAGLMGGGAGFINGGAGEGTDSKKGKPTSFSIPVVINNPDTGETETVTVTGATEDEARDKAAEMFPMLAKYKQGETPSREDHLAAFDRAREVNGTGKPPASESEDGEFSPGVDDDLRAEMEGGPDAATAPSAQTPAPTAEPTPETLEGEKINREWTAFSGESQSLGIPRAEMPQIKAEARGALTNFLKARGVESTQEEVLPGELKPTQAEYSQKKVDAARKFEGGDRAILVSQDGHVVDGHHQWMAKLTDKPGEPMRIIRLDAPIRDLLPLVKEMPSVETAGGASAPRGEATSAGRDARATPTGETPVPQPRPVIARGENKPAHFVKTLTKAVGLKGSDKASRFLMDFAPRLHRANAEAFEQMEVHALNNEQWAKAEIGRATHNSAAAYNQKTNTLYVNSDRVRDGASLVEAVVHEAGHFAERFALGEDFAQKQWDSLTAEQRNASLAEYLGRPVNAKDWGAPDAYDNARSEWVAFQFARVVRGDTDQMNPQMRTKLQRFLTAVRELARKWYSNSRDITTAELDRKILEVMEMAERPSGGTETQPAEPVFEVTDSRVTPDEKFDYESKPGTFRDAQYFKIDGLLAGAFYSKEILNEENTGSFFRLWIPEEQEEMASRIAREEFGSQVDDFDAGFFVPFRNLSDVVKFHDRLNEVAGKNVYEEAHAAIAEEKAGGPRAQKAKAPTTDDTSSPDLEPSSPKSSPNLTAKPAKKARTKQAKGQTDADRAENFFRVDRIIPRAAGGFDKVVEFNRDGGDGNWSVTVWRVNEDGSPIRGERLREHSTFPDERALAAWEKGNPVGSAPSGALGSPAVGQTLRDADATMIEDKAAKPLLDTAATNAEVIKRAAVELKSWPESVVAADGSGIDMKVADKGSMSARVWHLIRDGKTNTLDRIKAAWTTRVRETLENAQVRLVDTQDGTRVFVRKYEGGANHAVVVRPDGRVEEQRPFEGSLTTQFPLTSSGGRQAHMRVDWVRPDIRNNGEGLRQNAPSPTPPASTVSGPRQGEFRPKPDAAGGRGQALGSPAVTPPASAEMDQQPGPGKNFSRFPDSLRDRGQPVDRIEYDVRSQSDAGEVAKRIVGKLGEAGAEALALDSGADVRGDVRVGIIGELIARRAAELREAKSPEETARTAKEMNRLVSESRAKLATDAGQQIAMFAHVYRDPRVAAADRYIDAVHRRQNNRLGKTAREAVEGAANELNKATRKAAGQAAQELGKGLRTVKVSKSIWKQYREDAAQKMVDMVDRATDESAQKTPLQELAGRIAREMRSRMEGVMPEKPDAPKPTTVELLREAVNNREKYGEVFETARAAFVKEFGEGSPAVQDVDLALANIGARPYSDALLDRAIREAHRAMRVRVQDLARQHVTRTDAHAAALADGLVKDAGLTAGDAERVAAEFEERARGMITEARKKALEQMRKRFKHPKARVILDAIGKARVLNNLGALSQADMREAVEKRLGLPGVSAEELRKIGEIADRIETAPNSTARARAELDLLDRMELAKGVGRMDIAMAFWYANLLSGYTTQAVNTTGNAMLGALQLAAVSVTNPKQAGEAVRGYLDGMGTGFRDAGSILSRGFGSKELDSEAKTGRGGNVLELVARGEAGGRVAQAAAKPMRYVYRVMKAVDAVFYHSAREAHARVAVAKLLDGQFHGAELRKRTRESLGVSPGQLLMWRRQAETEGFKGFDRHQRVYDLMQAHRAGLRNADGSAVADNARRFALESTYNQEPEGWAGVLADAVSHAAESLTPGGVPVLKAFLPFLKVPTNVFNTALNFTPVGMVRAKEGSIVTAKKGEGGKLERRDFNADERARLWAQSVAGSTLMAGLAVLAYGTKGDDEEPWFSITAGGPPDWRHRQQLEGAGWRRNTVKLGKVRIPYQDSPLNVPLALIGSWLDALRYGKEKEETVAARAIGATLGASRVIFDTSMLSRMGQLMDMVQGKANPERVTQFLASVPANALVPGVNLMRQVDRTIHPRVYEADGPLGAAGTQLPFVRATGSVKTDVLGEEEERSPLERFVYMEEGDPLREALRARNLFISVPSKSTKLGNRQMTDVEYRHYVRISGQGIARRLRTMLPAIQRLPAENAERLIKQVTNEERERAKALVPAILRRDVF